MVAYRQTASDRPPCRWRRTEGSGGLLPLYVWLCRRTHGREDPDQHVHERAVHLLPEARQ